MLENIKSLYFVQKLFSNVEEIIKLKIVKYNKNLQNKNGINIKNYKIFKGKYITYEKKGKGKEYNNYGVLLFDGEFLNGERSGKGKEYNCFGNLAFEGEFLHGKRWNGKGKEYNIFGKVEFEGEYLIGVKLNEKE